MVNNKQLNHLSACNELFKDNKQGALDVLIGVYVQYSTTIPC